MRRKRSHAGLSVNAISGTYVVMLGMDLDRADCRGLRGFAIHGYASVPPYPASHGCVRVPLWAAPGLYARWPVGSIVLVR